MAEFLASIFGTEKDRVNCPFYFKTGACTHGERSDFNYFESFRKSLTFWHFLDFLTLRSFYLPNVYTVIRKLLIL